MSDEKKPQTAADFLKSHVAKGGFENDDCVLERAAEAFFSPPPERVKIVERVPDGYVPQSEEVAEYEKLKKSDPDFKVIRAMIAAKVADDPDTRELINSDHDSFLFEYKAQKEVLTQAKDAEDTARKKIEASKAWYRERMNSKDLRVREKAEIEYFLKYVK